MNKYFCPMHPEVVSEKSSNCPKCGMNLIEENKSQLKESKLATYKPLLIIIGLILLSVFVVFLQENQSPDALKNAMVNFMAGFFLVFSGFKILDLKGFAHGYSTYDLLARKFPTYGLVYPFLELFLGLAYLTRFQLEFINVFTVILMVFSGVGVLEALAKKRKFQCSCLGTIIKVPLTSVTLIEDFGMAFMALVSLIVL